MTRLYIILSLVLTVAAVAAALIVYPQLPERIPIHWNIHGHRRVAGLLDDLYRQVREGAAAPAGRGRLG